MPTWVVVASGECSESFRDELITKLTEVISNGRFGADSGSMLSGPDMTYLTKPERQHPDSTPPPAEVDPPPGGL